MKTRIPGTIEEAVDQLAGIGSLLRAKEWERAAIVYAFTEEGTNQHDLLHEYSCSIREFAAKGIKGLSTEESVRKYRKNWVWAIKNAGATTITPGDSITLPVDDWPGIASRPNVDRIAGMLKTPEGRITLRKAIAEDEDMVSAINRRHDVLRQKKDPPLSLDEWDQWEDKQHEDFNKATINAVRQILNALLLRNRGFKPSADAQMHLELIRPGDIDADYETLVAEVNLR